MAAKKVGRTSKGSKKTHTASAPRFVAAAFASVANMLAVTLTSGVILAGFFVAKQLT